MEPLNDVFAFGWMLGALIFWCYAVYLMASAASWLDIDAKRKRRLLRDYNEYMKKE